MPETNVGLRRCGSSDLIIQSKPLPADGRSEAEGDLVRREGFGEVSDSFREFRRRADDSREGDGARDTIVRLNRGAPVLLDATTAELKGDIPFD